MSPKTACFIHVLLFVANAAAWAQGDLNFRHLNTSNGLTDPVVRSITRDKYGYLWLGTQNGLNRFNGYEVKIFQHNDHDSLALPDHNVPYMFCDSSGELWLSQVKGLYKFNYSSGNFVFAKGSEGIVTNKMVQPSKDKILMSSAKGIIEYNTVTAAFAPLANKGIGRGCELLRRPVHDFCLDGRGNILIASDSGLIIHSTSTRLMQRRNIQLGEDPAITKIVADKNGNYWMVYYTDDGVMILRTDTALQTKKIYTDFNSIKTNVIANQIVDILLDRNGNMWVSSIRQGMAKYDAGSDKFIFYTHDPLRPSSIATNFVTVLYEDKNGFIWGGSEGNGAVYFHPEKNLFHTIQPTLQTPTLPDKWCRTASEDDEGNLWIGTVNGVAKYDFKKQAYSIIQNRPGHQRMLHINSTRSLLCNGDDVWIGTIIGLNRYNRKTGRMEFMETKDSIPHSFYWNIAKDHNNDIWFGCADGLLKYDKQKDKPVPLKADKLFGPYAAMGVRSIFEDSHHRLWVGLIAKGVLMVNPARTKIDFIDFTDNNKRGLKDGTITSVAEDSTGVIWVSTLSGFASYDFKTGLFKHYPGKDSSVAEITSSLMCDSRNRLWIAASSGIYMLDSSRSVYKSFGTNDGLPSIDFTGQPAYKMKNGNYMYPSLKGFVVFNPERYTEIKDSLNVYLSSFRVFGNEVSLPSAIEQIKRIRLRYDENFFSIQLTAINYDNPAQNWYAYKLEPFDKGWIYSQDRNANYTNVPGGDYVLYYKTSTDPKNWNAAAKTILISIDTVFYKTWWFIILSILLASVGFYAVYRYRLNQHQQLLSLQNKANSLEKEKALAMYESLKQQLNPHFLFNSLTSLGSLINSNPASARKFLDSLSKIYRYILKSGDNETVSLTDEIRLADIYMQLQQTRFREGLELKINISEEYLHRKIAPVTLQNLIENAMKHNIIDPDSPLVIEVFIEDGWLIVRNNLQKKSFVETSNRQGLKQMKSLYNYLTGKNIVVIEDNTHFTIKLPFA